MRTFRDLIACWPTVADFAREVGVQYQAAYKMHERNQIRSAHWDAVLYAARRRQIRVTADDLVRMTGAAQKKIEAARKAA